MRRDRLAALVVPAFLGALALILCKLGASAAGPLTGDPVQLLTPQPVDGSLPVAPPPGNGAEDGVADPPTPVLRMKLRAPESAAVGQELTYRIRVENISTADALHVIIRDTLPDNAKLVRTDPEARVDEKELSWDIGTLEGCHFKEITLVLAPTGNGDVRNCARVQFEHGQCTTTHIISPDLSIEKRGPTTAVLGETLDYQIVVTNMGTTAINDLTLYDQLPDGLQHVGSERPGGQRVWPVRKSLAPGETWRESYQIMTRALGKQCNKAIVVAGDLKRESESCVNVIERKVDLEFVQLPKEAYAGVPTPYQLRLTNKGKDPVTSLVLSANVPGPGYFVSANAGGQSASPGEVRWTIDNLPPGESRTFQYVIVTQKLGDITLRASAGSSRGVEARAEAKVTLGRIPDPEGVYFEVVQEPGAVTVGENTTYLINVVNQGRAPLTNIRLSAVVPDEMDIVSTKPTTAKIKGQQVDFEAFNAQPGSTFSYQVQVKAKKEGEGVIFDAKMSADQRQKEVHKQQAKTILPKE
jgi:uncharacterized repeat protein (TIGR01451 family)